jgi:hypothetical protein
MSLSTGIRPFVVFCTLGAAVLLCTCNTDDLAVITRIDGAASSDTNGAESRFDVRTSEPPTPLPVPNGSPDARPWLLSPDAEERLDEMDVMPAGECIDGRVGSPTSCKPESFWSQSVVAACAGLGGIAAASTFEVPCGNGFRYVSYRCCMAATDARLR